MSLQVWLPLNGDLQNKGLSDINVTNNGASINNNGKIGKCYQFGTNKYLKLIDYASEFLTYDTFSLSVWFKCTAQNTAHTGSALISGGNWNASSNLLNLALGNFSSDHYTKILISGSGLWSNGYSYNFYLNTWYNVVLTSGNGAMRVYVNGELIGDTYAAFTPATLEQSWICIGNGTYTQAFHFIGLMNDIRIYDHALSIKEVEEISKGLILHYPLDNNGLGLVNPNLIKNSLTEKTLTARNTGAAGDNYNYYTIFSTGLTIGQTYTFSAIVKLEGTQNLKCTVYNYNPSETSTGRPITNTFPADGITRGEWTFTAVNTGLIIYAGVAGATRGVASTFKKMKLEQDSIATPWCPNSADTLYSSLGYNNTIIYDTSGYQYDATSYLSFKYITDTPKYSVGITKTDSTKPVAKIPIIFPYLATVDEITLSCWWKTTAASTNTKNLITLGGNGFIRYGCSSATDLWIYSNGVSCSFTMPNITDNKWHMYSVTFNKGVFKGYLDGALIGTADKTSSFLTLTCNNQTANYIGAYTETNQIVVGSFSDARIYTTALSADDILQLYQTSILIDKNNNFYAYQYNENELLKPNITKTGISNTYQINENPNYLSEQAKSHAASSYQAYQFNLLQNLQANKTYTLQLWDVDVSHAGKTQAQTGVWIYWGGGNLNLFNWAGSSYFTNGHAAYLSKTFTITSAQATHSNAVNAWFNVYNSVGYVDNTMNMSIGKWKLTKGGQEVLSNNIYYKRDASLHSNNFYEI